MEQLIFFLLSLWKCVGVLELSLSDASPKTQNVKSPVVQPLCLACGWWRKKSSDCVACRRHLIYLSEQGRSIFRVCGVLWFPPHTPPELYTPSNFHCTFHFFTPDCLQFSICLRLQQLDFIHVQISAKRVGSNSAKYVTSGVPIRMLLKLGGI